jgi:hypothetical protein
VESHVRAPTDPGVTISRHRLLQVGAAVLTWWPRQRRRNWPHGLRRTVDDLSQDSWPTGRSAA